MIKHIGKLGDRKVAIVFREVPGEEHMALIIYPDIMPTHIHDSVMRVIESPIGQAAENLGDAMFRSLLSDGRAMLQTLHAEGMIKKVQAKQVVVTPSPSSHVNLDELNKIINEMKTGADAVKRLADLDSQQGMSGKGRRRDDYGREVGAPPSHLTGANVAGSDAALALDDIALATNMASQATRMEAEAKGLLAESARLRSEAEAMSGGAPKPKRGRQKKVVAADAS
jgi:hypothetical protein